MYAKYFLIHVVVIIIFFQPSSSPSCSECYDLIPPGSDGEWYDSSGALRPWTCKIYEDRNACVMWGDSFANFDLTANKACW